MPTLVPSVADLLVADLLVALATGLLALTCVSVMDAYWLTTAGSAVLVVGVGGIGFAAGIVLTLVCTRAERR